MNTSSKRHLEVPLPTRGRTPSLFDGLCADINLKSIRPRPFGLVRLLFEPTLRFWGSEEQQAYWLPLSRAGKILGTYCQTELGHGNFVRGIETTATYDVNAEEFAVHFLTPSSTKFWPGGLGFTATHAVVMARLIIGSKDHPTRQIVRHRVCITEVRQRLCDFGGTA
jgi:alkylation response protein AidB-like acyl-CoA dehydrogenase